MNLFKATGTIGGLTLVSRIAGFAREMLMNFSADIETTRAPRLWARKV